MRDTKQKRSRTSPGNLKQNRKQAKIDNYQLKAPTLTHNRFEQLDNDVSCLLDKNNNKQDRKERIAKSPPIFVAEVSNIQDNVYLL